MSAVKFAGTSDSQRISVISSPKSKSDVTLIVNEAVASPSIQLASSSLTV